MRLALEEDKDRRFSINETEEGVFVGRANITLAESRLVQAVERWKDEMSVYFRENHCDVKLCMLSQVVKRPVDVPKNVKLVDVLNSDLHRRFLLLSSSSNAGKSGSSGKKKVEEAVVKYKCTPQEVEEYHEQWRRNVAAFLLQQPHPVPLVAIGTHVVKPKNLGKNQKLIDVVKLDPLKRFRTHIDTSHNSLTRLSLTEEYSCEQWRQQIFFALQNSRSNRLMDLDVNGIQRPASIPRSVTMRWVILNDPQQRFRHAADYEQLKRMQSIPAALPQTQPGQRLPQNLNFHPNSQPRLRNPSHPMPVSSQAAHNGSFQSHWPVHQSSTVSSNPMRQLQRYAPNPRMHQRIFDGQTVGPSSRAKQVRSGDTSVPPGFAPSNVPPALPYVGNDFRHFVDYSIPKGTNQAQPIDRRQDFIHAEQFEEVAPVSLEESASSQCSDHCLTPNFLSFLNDSASTSGTADNSAVPFLEKTVASEFQEYSSMPGLLRFLSDAF